MIDFFPPLHISFAKKISAIKNVFATRGLSWPEGVKWIPVDDVISRGKTAGTKTKSNALALPATAERSDIAFLQYTSGSTSDPKGVMISHGNLAHNETIITRELRADVNTICVSWLPQYHDMGLIGSYLGALYCGGSGYYISPISFLKDPTLWIRSMSKFHATHTQAPNFAFALAIRKFREKGGGSSGTLDLSSMQHMINAAEPVDSVAIEDFYTTFEPHGLKRGVVVPTYGLAEHTVFVCSGGKQQLVVRRSAIEERQVVEVVDTDPSACLKSHGGEAKLTEAGLQCIVGCGYPKSEDQVKVLIVNAESCEVLPEDRVGEIWVTSPSKAQGYWGNATLTAEDFNARVAGSNGAVGTDEFGGYLRTGDEGFLHKGELVS
jgi:acyl-CoA synthetase (AMP-forming)/AMP-acid ligase II